MQPGYNPNQALPNSGYGGFAPQSSAPHNYNSAGNSNPLVYNGGGDVTYAQSGMLQTTKQVPPATSGSIPSQQPPITTMNGYSYNANTFQQPQQTHYQYQQQHQQHAYNHSQHPSAPPNVVASNALPPPGQYSAPSHPPPPQQQQPPMNYGAPPPMMGGRQAQMPSASNVPPPPLQSASSSGAASNPPPSMHSSSNAMQPPTAQMQNMQLGEANAFSYAPPPNVGYVAPQSGMAPPPNQAPPGPPQMGATIQQQQQQALAGPAGMRPSYPNQGAVAEKRLDPDAVPSPIQFIQDDIKNKGGVFQTDGKGLLPPLVTTPFRVEDRGSASPRFIRCTTYSLPATSDMAKTCQYPMGMIVKPLAELEPGEEQPIIVDPGPEGPIRCKRCKAYMCPQFSFTDGGRRFQCVLCNAITETPHDYFDHIDHNNQRVDKYRRPELCRGSYEFIVTKDYCRNDKFPNPPAFIFAIDVSYNAIKSGFVDLLCQQLRGLLDTLPKEGHQQRSTVKVGFITYNSVLHFYNLNSSLAQPQMMVVSDVSDVFIPLQDGFLVDVDESRHVIESLLQQIPEMFRDTRETDLVFAPVVQASIQALDSAECAGKLFMFHSSLPIGEAPGKLKNRDDRKLISTDKEKTLFQPASNFYEKLAKECVAKSLCVDLFTFPNQFIDIATLSQICQLTGGQLYKYNFFRADIDGDRFIYDLSRDIQRNIVFDAVMRVRTSTGIRAVDFLGSLYMNNTTDVELPAIDCDKSILVEIKHDDKINEEFGAYVQVALLYTSVSGQRRLRLHNLNLSVSNQFSDLYRKCETDALINYLAKKAIKAGLSSTSQKIRDDLTSQGSVILATYRKHVAMPTSPGQLILPECMKLLPAYFNCLLKSDAVSSSHDISTDDRAYLRNVIMSLDVAQTQVFFYPRLVPLLRPTLNQLGETVPVRCSDERLKENEVYLLHNGISLFLWVGQGVAPEWVHNVFGVQSAAQIDIDLSNLPVFDNDDSRNVRSIIEQLQSGKPRQMKLVIVRQRDKLEPWFKHFLVEDRGISGYSSYVDFLCHLHKEIRALLS